jgi:hypothetical protein
MASWSKPRRRHARLGALFLTVFSVGLLSGAASGQIIRDDFASGRFGPELLPCDRKENEISIVSVRDQGFFAAKLLVKSNLPAALVGLVASHDCFPNQLLTAVEKTMGERAELWEASGAWLKFGSDIWYAFSMYVDPATHAEKRLVIGQWKQAGDHSPMLAQRFDGRHFTVTIEQDNEVAGHIPTNTECRIYIALDVAVDVAAGDARPHAQSQSVELSAAGGAATVDVPPILSFAHDNGDVVHAGRATERGEMHLCARDLAITPHGELPNPWGSWIRMLYHIRATADANGLIEIWANDKPIVTVAGRIGFHDGAKLPQYFKFGPYRNNSDYESFALLARYRRAPRREDIQ